LLIVDRKRAKTLFGFRNIWPNLRKARQFLTTFTRITFS